MIYFIKNSCLRNYISKWSFVHTKTSDHYITKKNLKRPANLVSPNGRSYFSFAYWLLFLLIFLILKFFANQTLSSKAYWLYFRFEVNSWFISSKSWEWLLLSRKQWSKFHGLILECLKVPKILCICFFR